MSNDPLSRWQRGARPHEFTPGEASALAERLMQTHAAVYRDPRHPDNHGLSIEIAELQQRAHPGFVGSGGELVTPPPLTRR